MREQWREYSIFAQATESHPSESIRNPPRLLLELSLKRRAPVLSKKSSHPGEEVPSKRENAKTSLFLM